MTTRRRGLPSAPLVEDEDLARARNIKPGFFSDAELVECDFWVRLLFAGLWTLADRRGILADKPKQIKMDVFPSDAVDVEEGLAELHERGLIVRYEAEDGTRCIHVVNFLKHQNPHKDEKSNGLPEKPGASTVPTPGQHGVNPAESLNTDSLISESLNPESLTPESSAPAARVRAEYRPDFEAWWKRYPTGFGNKKQAAKQWDAMSVEERRCAEDGLEKWLRSDRWQRKFVKAAEIWLRDRWWENEPPDPPRPEANGRAPTMTDEFSVLRQQMSGSSGQSIEAAWRER